MVVQGETTVRSLCAVTVATSINERKASMLERPPNPTIEYNVFRFCMEAFIKGNQIRDPDISFMQNHQLPHIEVMCTITLHLHTVISDCVRIWRLSFATWRLYVVLRTGALRPPWLIANWEFWSSLLIENLYQCTLREKSGKKRYQPSLHWKQFAKNVSLWYTQSSPCKDSHEWGFFFLFLSVGMDTFEDGLWHWPTILIV